VAKVTVLPLDMPSGAVTFSVRKALKQVGQYGGRVRSRIEVAGSEFVIQNGGTLAQNGELAEELAPSWRNIPAQGDQTVVRRYDLEPFLVRDFRTGITSGRPDILHAGPFHDLLCKRITSSPHTTRDASE